VHEQTRGYPRQMSMLCHNLLEALVMQDKPVVDDALVREVVSLDLKPHPASAGGMPDVF
jgi:hypothetical protein